MIYVEPLTPPKWRGSFLSQITQMDHGLRR
jgi:hypothetical protein